MDLLIIGIPDNQDPFINEWHPLLRYAVAYLRSNSLTVKLLTLSVNNPLENILKGTKLLEPAVVFFAPSEENINETKNMIKRIKESSPKLKIVLGGIPASALHRQLLEQEKDIDYIIRGEWEQPLLMLIKNLKSGKSVNSILGLCSRNLENNPATLIDNLDILSEMATDDLAEALDGKRGLERTAQIITSRGCYGNCTFCGIPQFYRISQGKTWRGRSPINVVDEIEKLVTKLKIRYFIFQDDNFMGPGIIGKERARNIAKELLRRKVKIKFFFCCRLNDIDLETMKRLKMAGMDTIGISIESTTQKILNLYRKGIRAEDIYPTLDLLERYRIKTEVNLIFFNPYMSLDELKQNLYFFRYLSRKKYVTYSNAFPFNELKPFAWAPVTKQLKKDHLLNENDYSCLYQDSRVQQLVNLTRCFRRHPLLNFKDILLFNNLNNIYPTLIANRKVYRFVWTFTLKFRYFLTTQLIPSLLEEACDILENRSIDKTGVIKKINRKFKRISHQITQVAEALMQKVKS